MPRTATYRRVRRGWRRFLPLWLCMLFLPLMHVSFLSCTPHNGELLTDSILADSLIALAETPEDTDITYAPVAVAVSSLVDASSLMTEDTTNVGSVCDSLSVDTAVQDVSLVRRFVRWLTTPRDSLLKASPERFVLGSNFEVVDDSLRLRQWPMTDEVALAKGDEVVVAERMTVSGDSADVEWVKLARDQYTIGWVPEDELPSHLLPDDSVSHFVYFFSHTHGVAFSLVLGVFGLMMAARAVRRRRLNLHDFRRVDSGYAALFLWLLSTTAFLYALIQHFFPAAWEQFYYHPSLNPFDLAPIVALFVAMVWGTVWVALAVADELYHQPRLEMAFFYGLSVLSYGILLYVLFTFLPFYLGFPAWVGYTVWSVRRVRFHWGYRYVCGRCGAKMRGKGTCPVCGTLNE